MTSAAGGPVVFTHAFSTASAPYMACRGSRDEQQARNNEYDVIVLARNALQTAGAV